MTNALCLRQTMEKDFFDMTDRSKTINTIARLALGFVFFYHGLVPKILWLSGTEIALVEVHQFTVPAANVSFFAGVCEIILSFFVIFYRKSLISIYIAALALVLLLFDVVLSMPALLVEAFNPATINIACLSLCWIICISQTDSKTKV